MAPATMLLSIKKLSSRAVIECIVLLQFMFCQPGGAEKNQGAY